MSEVAPNPLTGSLLVLHEGPFEAIAGFAERDELFRLGKVITPKTLQGRVEAGLEATSQNLEAVSGGEFDLDGVLFLGLTGLAIHQAIEGNIMAPAVTLIWYALSAARRKTERKKDAAEPHDDSV